jgi:hypothetical protein
LLRRCHSRPPSLASTNTRGTRRQRRVGIDEKIEGKTRKTKEQRRITITSLSSSLEVAPPSFCPVTSSTANDKNTIVRGKNTANNIEWNKEKTREEQRKNIQGEVEDKRRKSHRNATVYNCNATGSTARRNRPVCFPLPLSSSFFICSPSPLLTLHVNNGKCSTPARLSLKKIQKIFLKTCDFLACFSIYFD